MADLAGIGLDWPVALLQLDRVRGEVMQANSAACRLFFWERQGIADAPVWPGWLYGQDAAPPGWEVLAELVLRTPSGTSQTRAWPRLIEGRPRMWQLSVQVQGSTVWLACLDAQAAADEAAPSAQAQLAQRDVLVREVHHRLKNNLQGVSGLLRHQAGLNPAAAASLDSAAAQLQAMAQVYGLPLPDGQAPALTELVSAVARAAGAVFGVEPEICIAASDAVVGPCGAAREAAAATGPCSASVGGLPPNDQPWRDTLWAHLDSPAGSALKRAEPAPLAAVWQVQPDQAGGLALVLNELMTNALKHGASDFDGSRLASAGTTARGAPAQSRLRCELRPSGSGVVVDILNPGVWPNPPLLENLPPGVVGLSLVKALLPGRGTRLEFLTDSDRVCARLHIQSPVLLPMTKGRPQSSEPDPSEPRA